MKSKKQLQADVNNIIETIEGYYDKLTDAMCNGDSSLERRYQSRISMLESRKEVLEWVLS